MLFVTVFSHKCFPIISMAIEGAFNEKIGVMPVALIQLTWHQIVDSDVMKFDFIFDFFGTFTK